MISFMFNGCSGKTKIYGISPYSFQLIEKIKLEVHNKEDVIKILGNPTFEDNINGNNLYYFFRKESIISFLKPKVETQNIIIINFNQHNFVNKISFKDSYDIKEINFSKERTTTYGCNPSILKEINNIFTKLYRF